MTNRRLGALAITVVLAAAIASGCSTVAPSPEPTPTLAPTLNPGLVEFTLRLRESLTTQGGFVQFVSEASADLPRLAVVAHSMSLWADGERRWLAEHPADACYQDAQASYQAAVEHVAAVGAGFEALAAASAPPTDVEGQAAARPLAAARSEMEAASTLAIAARATCG